MVVALGIALPAGVAAQQQARTEKQNMELVAYDDLQSRSAYQPIIHRQGQRWIAYIGHHGGVIDVNYFCRSCCLISGCYPIASISSYRPPD
jgi:hypothetical protein